LNCTVPLVCPPGSGNDHGAVQATGSPIDDGFFDAAMVVVVVALLTVCVSGEAVFSLLLKLLSPLYTALTVTLPTARIEKR